MLDNGKFGRGPSLNKFATLAKACVQLNQYWIPVCAGMANLGLFNVSLRGRLSFQMWPFTNYPANKNRDPRAVVLVS